MLKSTVYQLTIASILAIISIGGYIYASIYVGGMGSDLVSLNQKSNDLTIEMESLSSIKRVAQNIDQRNAEISKYIVPVENEGSINFVRSIEDTADKFGLKYNTNSIQIIQDDNLSRLNKEYLSIKETVTGNESAIYAFTQKMDTIPFNTKIKSFSLAKVGAVKGVDNQQLDLEILVIKEK